MPPKIEISSLPLGKLSNYELESITRIFDTTYRENSPGYDSGSFLNDKLNYQSLQKLSGSKSNLQLGHAFLAKKGEKVIGYLIAFDDINFSEVPAKFIWKASNHIEEDLDFLKSLVYLKNFAFVLHIAVLPKYEHQEIGQKLVKHIVEFYTDPRSFSKDCIKDNAVLIASTMQHKQYRIFNFLRKANVEFRFISQQISDTPSQDIRFRIAYILDKNDFFQRINKKTLSNTFDIVIPIQLNLASQDINHLIKRKPFEASILWSSFFTENEQLQKLNGMRKSYHGYYHTLQDAKKQTQFQQLTETLKEIEVYLRKKDAEDQNVPSLTPNLSRKGFEFFLINDAPEKFEFHSFANPLVFNIYDNDAIMEWLALEEFKGERERMTSAERQEWRAAYKIYVERHLKEGKEQEEIDSKEWKTWARRLCLNKEQRLRLWEAQKRIIKKRSNPHEKILPEDKVLFNAVSDQGIIRDEKYTQWNRWLQLHRKMYEADFLILEDPENYWWCHAVIPITFTEGVSGVMFSFRCPKVDQPEEAKALLNDLAVNISSSLSKNMLNIIGKLQQHVISMALDRYAMAAISIRNLSHNMGSHVLSHLGQEEVLRKLLNHRSIEEERLSKLASLHTYLRIRMSLLADMASNDPVASVPTYLNREILQPFTQQKLLLEYLTDYHSNPIRINFENLTGNGESKNRDVLIQLPNGELGRSAFYMILINIIRNCVKHSNIRIEESLELTVQVKNPESDPEMDPSRRGYKLIIFDNTTGPRSEVKRKAKILQQEYIEGNLLKKYEIRHSGLGLAEMLVAAKYLRKRPFGRPWSLPDRRIKFLEICAVENQENKGLAHLGFHIYLKKPRLLLLIDSEERLGINKKFFPSLSNLGIKIRTRSQLNASRAESHSHAIAIDFDNSAEDRAKSKHSCLFPIRWVWPKNEADLQKFCQMIAGSDREGLFFWAWEHWIHRLREKVKAPDPIPFVYYNGEKEIPSQPERTVVFDSHGYGYRDKRLLHPTRYRFYEPFGSLSPTHIPVTNWLQARQKNDTPSLRQLRLRFELEEAALTRVVIIDERIQRICQELQVPYHLPAKSYFEFLGWQKIEIPDPQKDDQPDLNDPNLKKQNGIGLINYLKPFLDGKAEFIVLHLGLIEHLLNSNITQTNMDWLEDHFSPSNRSTEIVFISGRGRPKKLPYWARFLPYNNIAKYILDTPGKYHLCRMLYGSRTRK